MALVPLGLGSRMASGCVRRGSSCSFGLGWHCPRSLPVTLICLCTMFHSLRCQEGLWPAKEALVAPVVGSRHRYSPALPQGWWTY